RVGGDRGDAVGGHQPAGAEDDLRGVSRGDRHRDEHVGAEHLRVVVPGVGEAEPLGALSDLPRIHAGSEGDAEVHGAGPYQRRAGSSSTRHAVQSSGTSATEVRALTNARSGRPRVASGTRTVIARGSRTTSTLSPG